MINTSLINNQLLISSLSRFSVSLIFMLYAGTEDDHHTLEALDLANISQ